MMQQFVPELRFPGFVDEWKRSTVNEVTSLIGDGTHSSPVSYPKGEYKYITSKNVRDGYLDLSNVSYVTKSDHKKMYQSSPVEFGDLLLTKDGASTGNLCLNTLSEEFSLLSSIAYIRSEKGKSSNLFLYQYLRSPLGQKEIKSAISGQAITRITLTKLGKFKLSIPDLKEQEKIAEFLTEVDEKIAKLEQKVTGLETYKRGAMQQIFSRQIRFTRPDGSQFPHWEHRKAGDLFKNISNRNHNSDLPVLSVTQNEGVVIRNLLERKINQSDAGIANYKVIDLGDFVISLRSFQGGIEMSNVKGISSPAYTVLRGTKSVNSEMFRHYFKRQEFISKLSSSVIGIRDGKQISYGPFSAIKLPLPSFDEQQQIATFLSSLDEKITQISTQLNKTKEFKKALLQRMFI